MEKLIEAVVSFLEIMVLGAIALIFLGYVIAFFHPIKQKLWEYVTELRKFLSENKAETKAENVPQGQSEGRHHLLTLREVLKGLIVLGLVYYAGVFSNVVAYWRLESAHAVVISLVQPSKADPRPGMPSVADSGSGFLWLPFRLLRSDDEEAEKKHAEALYLEMEWRNTNREAANELLDPIIKRLRLLRGTVLFAVMFGIAALIKVVFDFGIWLWLGIIWIWVRLRQRPAISCVRRACTAFANWSYAGFVDHDRRWLKGAREKDPQETDPNRKHDQPGESAPDFAKMLYFTFARAILPNILILVMSISIYIIGMFAWKCAEIDFHSTVLAGQATAVKVDTPKAAPAKKGQP
jgi:hypothetical protein